MTPTPRRRLAVVTATLLVAASSSACGLLFVQAPPTGHEQMASFSCTESNAGPVLDFVWGGLNVLGALAASGDPQDAYENSVQIVPIGLAWGAISTISAVTGFGKTNRCREARRLLLARSASSPALSPVQQLAPVAVPVAVVITPPTATATVGARVQLIAVAYSSSGAVIADAAFAWSSSNDAIASVSAAGQVTATAPGTVVVAARSGLAVATASITVSAN